MVCLLSLAGTGAVAAEPHAVAFIYHRFGEPELPSTNIQPERFAAQLDALAERGFQVWPLGRILARLEAGGPLPDKVVAITIDDAYASVYEHAFPILRERALPFTVFVATEPVDRRRRGFMTWEQLREMAAAGASFGNHSTYHRHLLERRPGEDEAAWAARVREDIRHAQARLEAELGDSVGPWFAYPYGEYSAPLAALVRSLGLVGFGQQSGAMGVDSDRRALPRYPAAGRFAALDDFLLKAATLPFPVARMRPWDPVLWNETRPRWEVAVAKSLPRWRELACYASGQGRIPVRWTQAGRVFETRAPAPLSGRRSRYNCTVPTPSGRWRWLSQEWVRPALPEGG